MPAGVEHLAVTERLRSLRPRPKFSAFTLDCARANFTFLKKQQRDRLANLYNHMYINPTHDDMAH